MQEFRWQDGERTIVFGRDALAAATDLLGEGYGLLSTERARSALPALAEHAAWTVDVPTGRVDEVAGELLADVGHADLLVALGGGRVVDVAKALAAARGVRTAAIPTTLSGAEMTAIHRHAAGVDPSTPRVRPAVVLNDPSLSASQPEPLLAASAANALGHVAEAMLTPNANPVATLAALAAARHLAAGLGENDPPEPASLALAALLAGYAIGSAGYGLHHVLAQTLARLAGVGHGAANAVMLPHSLRALRRRFPDRLAELDGALGRSAEDAAAALARRAGASSLGAVGTDGEVLERCVAAAAERSELALTPPAPDRDELRALYAAAWS
jgi:alcohol dehydrogenase class IV